MDTNRKGSYLDLIAVAVIWGAASPVIKYTLEGITPFSFLAYRFFISATIAFIYLLTKKTKFSAVKKNLPRIALYGFLTFSLALSLLFVGLEKSTVLESSIIGAAGPIVVTLGGAIFFKDQITGREKFGIALTLLGVTVNSIYPIILSGSEIMFTGNLFLIGFLLADSSGVLYSKKLLKENISPITITMIGFIVAAVTLIPFALIMEGPNEVLNSLANLELKYHLGVWYMALLSGLLAYFLAIKGEKNIEVSEAWLFMYLQPIFAIPLAVFWLKEELSPAFIIGATIIAIGVYIAETTPKIKQKKTDIAQRYKN